MSFLYPVHLLTTKGRQHPSAVCACLISYRKFRSWLKFVLDGYTKSCPENLSSVILIHCNSFHKKLRTSFLVSDIMQSGQICIIFLGTCCFCLQVRRRVGMFLLRFVRVYQTIEHNIAKQCHLKIYCHENLKRVNPILKNGSLYRKL